MKHIPLTQGKFALVDDEDYKDLFKYKWFYANGYAVRKKTINGKELNVKMHRVIMKDYLCENPLDIDHVNHNRLDNRKSNLRFCTRGENLHNRPKNKNNKSGYKGVYINKKSNTWIAQIRINKEKIHLGTFDNPIDASEAYKDASKKYYESK